MPVLRFYRRPAATEVTLRQLIAAVNKGVTGAAAPVARVESEFVYYVEHEGSDGLSKDGG